MIFSKKIVELSVKGVSAHFMFRPLNRIWEKEMTHRSATNTGLAMEINKDKLIHG